MKNIVSKIKAIWTLLVTTWTCMCTTWTLLAYELVLGLLNIVGEDVIGKIELLDTPRGK